MASFEFGSNKQQVFRPKGLRNLSPILRADPEDRQTQNACFIRWSLKPPFRVLQFSGSLTECEWNGKDLETLSIDNGENSIERILHPEDRRVLLEHLKHFLEQENRCSDASKSVTLELRVGTEGNYRRIFQETFGRYDRNGKLAQLSSIWMSVPRSRDVLRGFKEENRLFRKIFDSIPSWIFVLNERHEFEFVNSACAAAFGLPAEECVGRTASELAGASGRKFLDIKDPSREGAMAGEAALFSGRAESVSVDVETIEIDGKVRHLHTLRYPLEIGTSKASGRKRTLCYVQDLTYLKRVEQKISTELRDSKAINAVNEVLRSRMDLPAMFQAVSEIVLTALNADQVDIQYCHSGNLENSVVARRQSNAIESPAEQTFHNSTSRICASIEYAEKQIGTLNVDRSSGKAFFADEDEMLARAIANELAFALNQQKMVKAIEHRAYYDALTDLPNRYNLNLKLEAMLEQSAATGEVCSIVFLDLDGFKNVNDTLGHQVGDKLLKAVAERLQSVTSAEDTLGRLGGDEFAVLIKGIDSKEAGVRVAENYLKAFQSSFLIDQREVFLGASLGVSCCPDDGQDPITLMRHADMAMYQAKSSGKNACCAYSSGLVNKFGQRLELEADLRRAIELSEISMHYQPKFDLRSDRAVGMEALMRWNRHGLGPVSPSVFISVAEDCGYIVQLGLWAIETACRTAAQWANTIGEPINLAVNVSPLQLERADFVEKTLSIIERTGFDANHLELEVTETYLMNQIGKIAPRLQSLRDHGIKISIDDFGTGYSCMAYLQNLPLDCLKIDRSFVRLLDDHSRDDGTKKNAVMKTIVHLAQMMGLETVAEGIETREQLELTKEFGVDLGQGFFLGSPLDEADAFELLKQQLGGAKLSSFAK